MKKKKVFIGAAVLLCIIGLCYVLLATPLIDQLFFQQQADIPVRVAGKEIQILKDGSWQPFEIRGVNMGSAIPGSFPNEGHIPKQTYLRWFSMIRDMHANTIRVYNLQTPEFYAALAQFNAESPEKLYLIQTLDFPEPMMYSEKNILAPENHSALFREAQHTVSALHGDWIHLDREKDRLECYQADVSDYVLGYLFGIEWDEVFVDFVCRMNPDVNGWQGNFLSCTSDANPFEVFLAQWGDTLLTYEDKQYNEQRLVTFCNWADTDPFWNELQLQQPNQHRLGETNTEVQVDVEHIRGTEQLKTGIFASYNVYPYYPLFLQYGEYTRYPDETNNPNPYQKYLTDLAAYHSYPVIITEYGLPSSRSKAHEDIWRGYTHGGLNEVEQGNAIAHLFKDIQDAGCAGSLVFTWQDEWYKRTWNEQLISDPNGRAFWSNAESSEQHFGLLSFDPGDGSNPFYPDGDLSEWSPEDLVVQKGDLRLSMNSDEKYVYFLLEGFDPAVDTTIALDTLPDYGVTQQPGHQFAQGVDFLLHLDPEEGASLQIHDDYNLLVYSMADKMRSSLTHSAIQDLATQYQSEYLLADKSNAFHIVRRASGSIYSFLRHALDVQQVGRLKAGNGNPASPDFDSNADYCIRDNTVEFRIPWQLLNFRDPSRCTIVDELHKNNHAIRSRSIDTIYAGLFTEQDPDVTDFGAYPLTGWKKPTWHERPKASYYILQSVFEGAD